VLDSWTVIKLGACLDFKTIRQLIILEIWQSSADFDEKLAGCVP